VKKKGCKGGERIPQRGRRTRADKAEPVEVIPPNTKQKKKVNGGTSHRGEVVPGSLN